MVVGQYQRACVFRAFSTRRSVHPRFSRARTRTGGSGDYNHTLHRKPHRCMRFTCSEFARSTSRHLPGSNFATPASGDQGGQLTSLTYTEITYSRGSIDLPLVLSHFDPGRCRRGDRVAVALPTPTHIRQSVLSGEKMAREPGLAYYNEQPTA